MTRASVDLPEPLSPMKAVIERRGKANEISSRIVRDFWRLNNPSRVDTVQPTALASISGASLPWRNGGGNLRLCRAATSDAV